MASRGGGIRRRACMPPAPRLPCLGTSAGQRKREPVTGYPSPEPPAERLAKTWERERARFLADYNDRLLNGLTMLSIAAILAFRFVIKLQLGETIGWAAFLFLQARFMRKFFFFSVGAGRMLVGRGGLGELGRWGREQSRPGRAVGGAGSGA